LRVKGSRFFVAAFLACITLSSCRTTPDFRQAPGGPLPSDAPVDQPGASQPPSVTLYPELRGNPVPFVGDINNEITRVVDLREFDDEKTIETISSLRRRIQNWRSLPNGPSVDDFNEVVRRLALIHFELQTLDSLSQTGAAVVPPGVGVFFKFRSYCLDEHSAGPDDNEPANLSRLGLENSDIVRGILEAGAKQNKDVSDIQRIIWCVRRNQPMSEMADEDRQFLEQAGVADNYGRKTGLRSFAKKLLEKYGEKYDFSLSDLDAFRKSYDDMMSRRSKHPKGGEVVRTYVLPYRPGTGMQAVAAGADDDYTPYLYSPFRPYGAETFVRPDAFTPDGPIIQTQGNDGVHEVVLAVANPKSRSHAALIRPGEMMLVPDREDVQRIALEPTPLIAGRAYSKSLSDHLWDSYRQAFVDMHEIMREYPNFHKLMKVTFEINPWVAQAFAVYEFNTGRDILSGAELSAFERSMSLLSVVGGETSKKGVLEWFRLGGGQDKMRRIVPAKEFAEMERNYRNLLRVVVAEHAYTWFKRAEVFADYVSFQANRVRESIYGADKNASE